MEQLLELAAQGLAVLRIRQGGKAYGVRLTGGERRYDIGNFDAYFQAFVEFALADPKHGEALRRHLEDLLHVPHA
jgi:UTP--glucose-1-phosphate uridylyltransferase